MYTKSVKTAAELRSELAVLGSPAKAVAAARFFKTGAGQYAEGDRFIGVTVPEMRRLIKHYRHLPLSDIETLLTSPIHEERFCALILLVTMFQRGDASVQEAIYHFYMSHTRSINNWDLVDASAEFIVGPWLQDKDKSVLSRLARSDNLWERRIAMLTTFAYIKQGRSHEALIIIAILLHDDHDLIQKAVGWMLREIGKRCSLETERAFLSLHASTMPRTTLRYAIERLPKEERDAYLGRVT